MVFVSCWGLLNKSLREVLERLALSLAYLEDGAHEEFMKEGAPEEARGDFELLNMAERESVKVRVDQLATRPAEKLAMDYIDRKRRREAERRD